MATQNSMATFEQQPKVNYCKSPPLPTSSDTREQIIANSLVIYPNVAQEHINKFPNIPVRAADIFDVCVADVTKQYGGTGNPKYIASLTHAHEKYPAARMLLMNGGTGATIDGALHNLLEHSVSGLGVRCETLLPVREGCAQVHTGMDAGWALHEDTTRQAFDFSQEVRQLATDFNMKKKRCGGGWLRRFQRVFWVQGLAEFVCAKQVDTTQSHFRSRLHLQMGFATAQGLHNFTCE